MSKIYLMPVGKNASLERMNSTLLDPVPKEQIFTCIDKDEIQKLNNIFSESAISTWGFQTGKSNTNIPAWEHLTNDDFAIFVPSKEDLVITKITYKIKNIELAKLLWGKDQYGNTWDLIFFVRIIAIIQVRKKDLLKNLGYSPNDVLQKHRDVTEKFVHAYGSLENFIKINSENIISVESFSQETTENIVNSLFSKKEKRESRLNELRKSLDSVSSNEYVFVKGLRYRRNQIVVKYAKERADYACEVCGFTFIKKDGTRYVEAAHVIPLKLGSVDTIENVRALCANCHKKLDKGNEEVRKEVLNKLILSK